MRFICVRLRSPKGEATNCVMCQAPIGEGYVRDLTTGLVYHTVWCMETHIGQSILCIEDAVRYSV